MSQDESSLGRQVGKKTFCEDSNEDESDDSGQLPNTRPRRRNPDQTSPGILPLKEGTMKFKDNIKHYDSKSENENGIEGHLEDSKVDRRAKGDIRKKSHLKRETNIREIEDIMSQDESSLGRKVGKKTFCEDSNEDESDDSGKLPNTKPRRRNPDQTSPGILPLKEGTMKFKDDIKHYDSKSENENGIEGHLEDSKVYQRAKGDIRKKSHLKRETNIRDDLSDDEEHISFEKETELSPMKEYGDRNYESYPNPTRTPRHHDEERKKRGLNLELEDRKITTSLSNQQTNTDDQVSDESGDGSRENNLRDRIHVQKKSLVKKGNHNMLHQHVGSDSDSACLSERTRERQVEESTLKKGSLKRSTKKSSHGKGDDDSSENNLRESSRGQGKSDVKKRNRNMLHQHDGSDSDSNSLSERTMERQVEESSVKKGSLRRSTKKNSHGKGGSDSESASEGRNPLSRKDMRDSGKIKQERYSLKKIPNNESESDPEYEQDYKSNGRKKLSRKDTRDFRKMKEERESSKRNPDKKISKYEEQNKSDSDEDQRRERRPHSQVSPVAKETYYSEVKTASHLSYRSQSGRERESRNRSSSKEVSESDSDSDNYHVKEVKDPREARHDNIEKTVRKGIKEYRKQKAGSQSELSDESYADKQWGREESYMRNAPRRRENIMSHNDIEPDLNEEQQRLHTPRAKSEHRRKGDRNESYGKNFLKEMETIDGNVLRRESKSYSSRVEKERHTEHFTSKHSREDYHENNGGKSAYQQTESESESEELSSRKTSDGGVQRRYIKSAHGMHVYKDPYSENKHFKNADKGKREDTMQNFDYENDGAEYLPIRNIQRRRDERYMEISDQEYHHKEGRSKEPKGRDAVRGTRDGYMMPATEQYSDEDTVYQTRRTLADEETDYQNPKGEYRKPRREHGYRSQSLHDPSNGSYHFESNVGHESGWSKHKMSAEVVDKKKNCGLSVISLISIMLGTKKCQASINLLMKLGLKPREVWPVVHANPHLFNVHDPAEIIRLRPQIRICSGHLKNGCDDRSSCYCLHICPKHLLGLCINSKCALGHKITSQHNALILNDFYLNDISEQDILKVLSLSVPNLHASHNLKICSDYNGRGCKRTNCSDLHICQDYLVTLKCDKNFCQLNHRFQTEANIHILENLGIDTNESPRDIIKSIKDKYPYIFKQQVSLAGSGDFFKQKGRQQFERRNAQQTRRMQSQSRDDETGYNNPGTDSMKTPSNFSTRENLQFAGNAEQCSTVWCDDYQGNTVIPEICYYSVNGRCRYEEIGCKRLHADRFFHWQVKQRGKGWINLRPHQVDVLERSYCDPAQDGVVVPSVDHTNCPKGMLTLFGKDSWQGHFPAMILCNGKTQMSLDLRRICSENIDGNVKCAQYLWYFLDQNNVWVQYGNTDTTKRDFLVSNITSEDIEKEYQKNVRSSMTFKNSMFTYLLDFQSMTQTNTSTNVTRKVRRRPVPHLKGKSGWFRIFDRS